MARVSKRLRFEILRRDGFKCRYCGTVAAAAELRVDHVIPEALGGPSEPSNLATSCDPCNSGKSSTTPDAPMVEDVSEDALRWTHAMRAAAESMEKQILARREKNAFFAEIWGSYKLDNGDNVPLPQDWEGAVVRLESAGLTYILFEEATEVAMRAFGVRPENRFRYFCGVAWNMVTKLQEQASQASAGERAEDESPFSTMSREDLEDTILGFEHAAETLLTCLPVWLQEGAERLARDDFRKAEQPDEERTEVLPHILRHLGDALAACAIEPPREAN
jgi:hypothetical protein